MGDSTKTFLDHLEEFRGVILRCLIVFLMSCVVVGCFFPYFANLLNYPLTRAVGTGGDAIQGLVTTSPMGVFSVLIQVCFLGGLAISLPIMLFFIARFVAPGLSLKERGVLVPGCVVVLLLFIIGGSFSYFFVLPTSLSASITLNKVFGFELIWSAPMYYGLVVWMTIGIGLCFEFPLALVVMMYLGIITSAGLKKIRRHMIVGILVLSALITPSGDPFSLAILAIPLYGLYELAIIVGARYEPKPIADEDDDDVLPWPVE